jgi:AraC-like DNA-binding protein
MAVEEIDVIVRVAGATLMLWAAFGPGGARAGARRYFIPLALCIVGFLAGNTPDSTLRLSGPVGRLGVILTGYAAVFLWWWCLAVFDRRFRPQGMVLGVGLAWILIASVDRGLIGDVWAGRGLSWLLVGLGLIMVAHLAWRLTSDRADDMVDRRREARVAVVAVLAAQLLTDLTVDLTLGLDWGPQAFTIVQNAAFLGFVGWLLTLDLAIEVPSSDHALPGRSGSAEQAARAPDPVLTARLHRLLEVDQLHLNPDLTFEQFAKAMNAPERAVRNLVNQHLGHDHFRTFLNTHRVAEAKRRLSDPEHRDDKLIAIAMDSGFASLASFNRVFREMEGCTPSAFRAASQPGSEERSAQF